MNEKITNQNQSELLDKEREIIDMIIKYDRKTKAS